MGFSLRKGRIKGKWEAKASPTQQVEISEKIRNLKGEKNV